MNTSATNILTLEHYPFTPTHRLLQGALLTLPIRSALSPPHRLHRYALPENNVSMDLLLTDVAHVVPHDLLCVLMRRYQEKG